jgi:cytochrome c oxidase subunit 2
MMKLSKLIVLAGLAVFIQLPTLYSQQEDSPIEVHAKRFSFVPAEITVKKGQTVKLHLVSDDVPHSLVIKDLGVNQSVSKDHPADVTFTANDVGDFHGQCGRFCGSGHGSMIFTVHVKPD